MLRGVFRAASLQTTGAVLRSARFDSGAIPKDTGKKF
jgi:hypothetical protein